ncbi:MAG: UDP-N-acetylmuramoyl-tripeptide--D-alanyl-D-alanine ligase [Nonlabens sp.]
MNAELKDLHQLFLNSTGISTDTRTLKAGNLFIALSGSNYNGNSYVEAALEKGASHIICTDAVQFNQYDNVTVVQDSLGTLQQLARHHRNYLGLTVLAITGSNGKTTTKELVHRVLSSGKNVVSTKGNLNNHIGVPLTLLTFTEQTEIGIVEMGANHQGEIHNLCEIAAPDYGLVTNFGLAHLEGFGGVEGVKKGKSEMYDYLRKNNGSAFVLHSEEELIERSNGVKQLFTSEQTLLKATENYLELGYRGKLIRTRLTGAYNFNNIIYSIAVGEYFNIPHDLVIKSIESYVPDNNRSQVMKKSGYRVIWDAYNANPSSMIAAIDNLARQQEKNKVAILGDMYELGEHSHQEHQRVFKYAREKNIDIITYGNLFSQVPGSINHFEDIQQLKTFVATQTWENSCILIKGSRGVALERIADNFN